MTAVGPLTSFFMNPNSLPGTTHGEPGGLTRRARKMTKIVATMGPSSSSEEVMRNLMHAGMNVARLNMSHGDHSDHAARLNMLRTLSQELQRPVAVLADLQGPKIRTGRLIGGTPVEWKVGAKTIITVAECPDGSAARVGTTYSGLAKDVVPGNVLLVDDGKMRLHVDSIDGDDIHCTVVVGGLLRCCELLVVQRGRTCGASTDSGLGPSPLQRRLCTTAQTVGGAAPSTPLSLGGMVERAAA